MMKSILRTVYRALPFKRPLLMAARSVGLGRLFPARLKPFLVFEGDFTIGVEDRRFRMQNGYGRDIEAAIFWDGLEAFEGSTFRLWRDLCARSRVILDVGANTGIYALFAKAIQPAAQVHAFEPLARVHEILAQNCRLNADAVGSVNAHRIALSDYSGEGDMFDLPVEHMYTASLNRDIHAERGQPIQAITEHVRVLRLDDFLTNEGCDRVDLLKVDVESHEASVLRGLGSWLPRFHPTLIVEIWNNEVGRGVQEVLSGCDYQFHALTDAGPRRTTDIRNDEPDRGYINYLICTPTIARALRLEL